MVLPAITLENSAFGWPLSSEEILMQRFRLPRQHLKVRV